METLEQTIQAKEEAIIKYESRIEELGEQMKKQAGEFQQKVEENQQALIEKSGQIQQLEQQVRLCPFPPVADAYASVVVQMVHIWYYIPVAPCVCLMLLIEYRPTWVEIERRFEKMLYLSVLKGFVRYRQNLEGQNPGGKLSGGQNPRSL